MAKTTEVPLSAFAAPVADVSMGGQQITNVGDPVADTDAANKLYVDTEVAAPRVRGVITKTTTATLTDAEVMHQLIRFEPTANNQALTLPTPSALDNAGADLVISVKFASGITGTTLVSSGGFHGAGTGVDTVTFASGEGCHMYCDGTNWYLIGCGPSCTLS